MNGVYERNGIRPKRQIFIDANPYRTRVVLLENGDAVEVYSENRNKSSLVGSIYRGRVASVLLGMSAAFVDIGMDKNAFLSLRDFEKNSERERLIGVENELASDGASPALRIGQELIVQIVKDPHGSKAARVSTQISISGHLVVLFPTSNIVGVSRNITDDDERARLHGILEDARGKNIGVIARTAAGGRDEAVLRDEIAILIEKWDGVKKASREGTGAKCLLGEYGIVERTLRDLLRPDVTRVVVNDRECYEAVCALANEIEPGSDDRIVFQPNEPNLFETLGIEKQLDEALRRRVYLKSGAYIVIDHTEALVSIDVNSGKNIGGADLQQTALATNCEAAWEIARQLRLRNIGGMVIIDFIDLISAEDKQTVVRTLKNALSNDRIACIVHGMTTLGLVEVTRKKLRDNLASYMLEECQCCGGRGRTATAQTVALKLRARLLDGLLHGNSRRVQITAAPSVLRLISQYAEAEAARCGLDGVELSLVESRSDNIEEFSVRYLGG